MAKSFAEQFVGRVTRKITNTWDKFNGYDFLTTELPEVNGLDSKYANAASPTGNRYLRRLCDSLDITNEDSIVDVGCARGSAMRLFTKYPFKRIGGLELAEKVAEICEANFKKMGDQRVVTYHADATTFEHYGDYNYFYLANPVPTAELHQKILDRMSEQCSGDVVVIYLSPVHIDVMKENGFHIKAEYDDAWDNGMVVLTKTY